MPLPQIDFDPSVDYYAALGVTAEASGDDIKQAYRRLARQYHPDSTGGDKPKELRFKIVQGAYDVLGDDARRRLYDEIRGSDHRRSRGSYAGPSTGNFSSWFDQLFGGSAPRRSEHVEHDGGKPRQVRASDGTWLRVEGTDVHSDVRISFDRAIVGTTAAVATTDGEIVVKIPPGTASGAKLRLRGKGVGDRSEGFGDHYVTVQIDVPSATDLDEDSKKILAQLVGRLHKHRP